MKYLNQEQKTINHIVSEINGLLCEMQNNSLDKRSLFNSIANIMIILDKSDEAIKVFKDKSLGEEAKETVLMIKVNLGY